MPTTTSVTHEFLSELVDIIDKVPVRQHEPSYLQLRESIGKPPLPSLQEQVAQASVNFYFTSNFTVNPPTSTTQGSSINTGTAQFVGGRWNFGSNTHLTFNYHQDPFQDMFAPVTLVVHGIPSNEAATNIFLTVNQLEIFNDYQLSKAQGAAAGTYEFFIPSVCFLGGRNTFRFGVRNAGQSISISRVDVTSATGLGDIDATYNALCQLMSLVGTQNRRVVQHWESLRRTLAWYPDYFGIGIRNHAADLGWRLQGHTNDMTADANGLGAVSRNYFQNQLPMLLDPQRSFEDRRRILNGVLNSVQFYLNISNSHQTELNAFRQEVAEFRKEIQEIATRAEADLKRALEQVDRDIDTVESQLTVLRIQLRNAQIGLAASVTAGPIGVWGSLAFLGPIAGPIAAVGFALASLIGIGISAAFIDRASREINQLEARLDHLTNERVRLANQLQRVQEMTQDIINADEAFTIIAQYSRMFSEMWRFLSTQLMHIESNINSVPNEEFPLWDMVLQNAANQMTPFFMQIESVISHFMNPRR